VFRFFAAISTLFFSFAAFAGQPRPWQFGFQDAASPVMEKLTDFHNLLLYIIFAVAIFVMLLIAYVCIRFNAKANPVPSKTSHNTLIEIIWTAVPVIILVLIAIPSMRLLYYTEDAKEADMTLKVIGNQWYWSYQYPDFEDIAFDSYMIPDDDIKPGELRLLEVDNKVVLPINTKIRVQITGSDVIHNWAVPALGLKIDAIPGRLNEGWTLIDKSGTYYGQCSELCGVGHGFMPIQIVAVTKAEFSDWVKTKTHSLADSGESKELAAIE